jgi:hypothetical protein
MDDLFKLLVLAGVLALVIWGYRRMVSRPKLQTFKYKYQRNPFDEAQYFTIKAADQTSANEIAKAKFEELFRDRQTVMPEFYSVER